MLGWWDNQYFWITCSLNIVFFPEKLGFFWTPPVLMQRWCSTSQLAGSLSVKSGSVHTLTPKENRERPECIFKSLKKHSINWAPCTSHIFYVFKYFWYPIIFLVRIEYLHMLLWLTTFLIHTRIRPELKTQEGYMSDICTWTYYIRQSADIYPTYVGYI